MEKFLTDLAEMLEVDLLDPDKSLDTYENWDSLTILSVIAMLDCNFGINMNATDISRFKTAAELYAETQQKKNV